MRNKIRNRINELEIQSFNSDKQELLLDWINTLKTMTLDYTNGKIAEDIMEAFVVADPLERFPEQDEDEDEFFISCIKNHDYSLLIF